MNRVQDKVVVITGAASGLGLADAKLLVTEGALVIMTDIDITSGEALAQEFGAIFIQQDVSDEAGWSELMKVVKRKFGRLDGLVNNAGIAPIANIEDLDTETSIVAKSKASFIVNQEASLKFCSVFSKSSSSNS